MKKLARSSFALKAIVMVVAVCVAVAIPYLYSLSSSAQPSPDPTPTPGIVHVGNPEGFAAPTEHPMARWESFIVIDGTPVPIDPKSTRMPDKIYIDSHPDFGVQVSQSAPGNSLEDTLKFDEKGNYVHQPLDEALAQGMTAHDQMRPPVEKSVVVGGPHTAGSALTINGQSIQLPADFYVQHVVRSIMCDDAFPDYCRKAPIHILNHSATGNILAIDANGSVYNDDLSDEQLAQVKGEFEAILRQLEGAE